MNKRTFAACAVLLLLVAFAFGLTACDKEAPGSGADVAPLPTGVTGVGFQPIGYYNRLLMEAKSVVYPGLFVDQQGSAPGIRVQETVSDTYDAIQVYNSASDEKFAIDGNGHAVFTPEADDDLTSYDYLTTIQYYMTGTGTKDRNYGLYIVGTRPAGQELTSGDHDEAGLKIRVDTEAVTTTAGTVLRAIDAEAKADNDDGTVTNLFGASLTAKSDTGAGSVGTMVALTTNSQANAEVTDEMGSADFRLMRQSANEPTLEYVIKVRNGNTSGSGADAAIYVQSNSSSTYDNFDYGLDMSAADINTAEIRFGNGTTLGETTDTVLTFSEFLAAAEQTPEVVSAGSTIVATGTYQPLTSSGSVTTSTSTPIAVGTKIGQLLILVNENASDTITVDGTGGTVECKSDVVLGAQDTLFLLWNGADWICISGYDNS
jgi:hypothetical protein